MPREARKGDEGFGGWRPGLWSAFWQGCCLPWWEQGTESDFGLTLPPGLGALSHPQVGGMAPAQVGDGPAAASAPWEGWGAGGCWAGGVGLWVVVGGVLGAQARVGWLTCAPGWGGGSNRTEGSRVCSRGPAHPACLSAQLTFRPHVLPEALWPQG